MKLTLFLAADYANITRERKLNVMGIFNEINAAVFPSRHPSMHLVISLGAELGEPGQTREFTINLLDEDGKHVLDLNGQFQIPKSEKFRRPEVNLILGLKDIVFPHPGTYVFVLLIDKDQKGELTFYVNQISEAA